MAHSLGLTLYNLAHRRDPGAPNAGPRPPRPAGVLVWLHAPDAQAARSVLELARRIVYDDGHPVLVTCPDALPARPGVIQQPPPLDFPPEVRAFLDHWRPAVCVFSEGELRPALLHEATERGLPTVVINGLSPYIMRGRDGWFPGLLRSTLGSLRHVLTTDEVAARTFRKAGALLSAVRAVGRMEEESAALPCLEAERAALAVQFATRPVWLAAALPEPEEATLIDAHRSALRLAHRLLLIIVPDDPARTEPLKQRLIDGEGWTVALRGADQEPDAGTEVYIADSSSELGLWYRLAPVTFLGGSLSGQGCIRNPLEPAALGSAILHGPRPGKWGLTLGRLGAARAARAVSTATDLGDALGEVLSPDRAARLAQAAWNVASDGAEVTEQVVTLLRSEIEGGA